MKDLGNKLIVNLHVFLFIYAIYSIYVMYDDHSIALNDIQVQLPSVNAEVEQLDAKLREIEEFKKESEASKLRVEQVAKNIESIQRQLPSDINEGQILSFFGKEADLLNMKDTSFVSGVENKSQLSIGKEFKIKGTGTYLQFSVFFERLGNADRIYNIKDLKLLSENKKQKGRFPLISMEATVEAFRFNPDFQVEREYKSPVDPNAAPTVSPAPAPSAAGGE